MNNDIQLFSNPMFGDMRIIMQDGEPWFVAKDVCDCLELTNARDAVSKLRDKDKGVAITDTLGGKQEMTTISENGLYELVFNSRKPEAKQFKYWVCDDVLPTIRKHGVYATPATVEKMLQDPDNIIKIFQALKAEREAKEAALAQIEKQRPQVIFAEAVECSKTSILIGELAKLIKQNGVDIGQNRLFQWLRQNGYLTRDNSPTQYSMERQLFEVVERTINNPDGSVRITLTTKVTGKGQQYFINKFLR